MKIKRCITNQYGLLRDKLVQLYSGMGCYDSHVFPTSDSLLAGRLNLSPTISNASFLVLMLKTHSLMILRLLLL